MWLEKDNSLYKKFEFKDFLEAFDFMSQVAQVAEAQNHHPRWQNVYNSVEIWLNTHDAGDKVTDKDKKLAKMIDEIYKPKLSKGPIRAKLFTDGGSRGNPGPSASGFVILDPKDQVLLSKGVYLGIATNNQAEYTALKLGLTEAKKMGIKDLEVYMDSELIVKQLNGFYRVKHNDLKPIYEAVKVLVSNFAKVSFSHVPREENTLADAEVNKALDAEVLN